MSTFDINRYREAARKARERLVRDKPLRREEALAIMEEVERDRSGLMAACTGGDKPKEAIYEIWIEEYVNALAQYLAKRFGQLSLCPARLMEVGAGDGRLTKYLTDALRSITHNFTIVATDDHSWEIEPTFPVERSGLKAALGRHEPHIVICSWMPYGEDWSHLFRACSTLKEYILIGESDAGCCGHAWETWGNSDGLDAKGVPPYRKDGWGRLRLDDLSKLQLCRTDWSFAKSHSATYAFRPGI